MEQLVDSSRHWKRMLTKRFSHKRLVKRFLPTPGQYFPTPPPRHLRNTLKLRGESLSPLNPLARRVFLHAHPTAEMRQSTHSGLPNLHSKPSGDRRVFLSGAQNSTPCSDIRTDLQVRRSAFCDWSRHHALTSELDLQVASGSREPGGPDGPAGPQLILS